MGLLRAHLVLLGLTTMVQPARAQHASASLRSPDTLALVGVNVVPMDRQRILWRRTVLVAGGTIVALGSIDSIAVPASAIRVEGRDRLFVLPGLADMHGHVRYASDLTLLLANGVTTVRNMRGTPFHLALRSRVASGALIGPRIVTAGPVLYGDKGSGATAAEARALVDSQAKAGYDFIKPYDGLPKESYAAAVAEAARKHLPVAGHVPGAIGVVGALRAHQASIEHAEQIVYHYFNDDLDDSRIPIIAREIAAAHTFVTPTLEYIFTLEMQWDNPDTVMHRPEVRYLDGETYAFWRTSAGHSSALNHVMEPFQQKLVRGLRDAGVKLLAGTDFYIFGNVAGFSLHRELEALVDAGLTPYEALATATINAAEFLGDSARSGTVRVGKRADLLVLDANPLTDIRNSTRLAGVVRNGRWVAAAELRRQLDSLAGTFSGEQRLVDRLLSQRSTGATIATDSIPPFQESTVNQVAYYLLGKTRVAEAVAAFELVTQRYPNSANAFDGLGDGYRAAERKADAIRSFETSLKLNGSLSDTRRKLADLLAGKP